MTTATSMNLESDFLKYVFTIKELDIMALALRTSSDKVHESIVHDRYTSNIVQTLIMSSHWQGYIESLVVHSDLERITWFMQESTRQRLSACLNGFEMNSPKDKRAIETWKLFSSILTQRDVHVAKFGK